MMDAYVMQEVRNYLKKHNEIVTASIRIRHVRISRPFTTFSAQATRCA